MSHIDDVMTAIVNCLRENGYKITRKRQLLLRYLISEDRYVSAKECYQFMIKQYASISYDTIYRNLFDFVQLRIVDCLEWDNEKHYHFHCQCGNLEHHHHFICTHCGRIIELEHCPVEQLSQDIPGCEIESHRIELYGRCPNCREK